MNDLTLLLSSFMIAGGLYAADEQEGVVRSLEGEWSSLIGTMDLANVGLNAWTFSEDEVSDLASLGIKVFSHLGDSEE